MIAYLGHYDPPFAREANDALWRILSEHALCLGLSAPAALDRTNDYSKIWADPELVFAQACGLPLITSLKGQVRLIAAPVYAFPGCVGADYRSFIVVREDAPFANLADLAGARVAINSMDSHSGYTALYHTVIPLAGGKRYFGSQLLTGAHAESLKAVQAGTADACACDCVTFGLMAHHQPRQLAGLRVLAKSEAAPVPAYITCGTATDWQLEAWREALRRAFSDPRSAAARALLGLQGFIVPPPTAYRRIAEMSAATTLQAI